MIFRGIVRRGPLLPIFAQDSFESKEVAEIELRGRILEYAKEWNEHLPDPLGLRVICVGEA